MSELEEYIEMERNNSEQPELIVTSEWVEDVSLRRIITEEAFLEDVAYFESNLLNLPKPDENAIKGIISAWNFSVPQQVDLLSSERLCKVLLRIINYRWQIITIAEIVNRYANAYEAAYSYLFEVATGLQTSAKNVGDKKSVARFRLKKINEEMEWAKNLKAYVLDYIKVIESMTISLQSGIKMLDLQRAVNSKYEMRAESYSYNDTDNEEMSISNMVEHNGELDASQISKLVMKPERKKIERKSLRVG